MVATWGYEDSVRVRSNSAWIAGMSATMVQLQAVHRVPITIAQKSRTQADAPFVFSGAAWAHAVKMPSRHCDPT